MNFIIIVALIAVMVLADLAKIEIFLLFSCIIQLIILEQLSYIRRRRDKDR